MLVNIFCIVVQQLFDNYVRAGIIPKGKKEVGFNELSWSLKDFDGVKLQRIHKKININSY